MARKQILILEDNEVMLKNISCIVKEVVPDVNVYAIDDVDKAYKIALEHTVDIFMIDIILDTSKPGDVSGLNFVEHIRQIEKYMFTPVIIVTSLDNPKMYSYEKLHCYGYIEKPFEPENVKELLRQAVHFPTKIKKKDNH